MKPTIYLKKTIANPLFLLKNIGKRFYYKYNNDFVILMYHRIINKSESETYLQDGMYVEPNTFLKQIEYLKGYFNIISLENVFRINDLIFKKENGKPFCIITFDDGWKDFYENAYPILKTNEVPATVFLPTDFIGTTKRFWTESLAKIIYKMNKSKKERKNGKYPHNPIISKIENMNGSNEEKIESATEALKILTLEEINQILEDMARKWEVDLKIPGRSFLSWDEIKEMYKSGLIFFGSHTRSHQILTTISEKMVRDELIHSKNKLIEEGVVNHSFIPFVYPNGNYNMRIAELVEEEGYSLALTTEKGWNDVVSNRKKLYQLKRIGIHQDMTSTKAMLACRIHGIY